MTDKIINTCVGMETSQDPKNFKYSENAYSKKELKNAIKIMNKKNEPVCEWIDTSKVLRPYFDIDYKYENIVDDDERIKKEKQFIKYAKLIINDIFSDAKYAIENNSGNEESYTKISFHIVVKTHKIQGYRLYEILYQSNFFENKETGFIFDKTIYKPSGQKFRIASSVKGNNSLRKPKIIKGTLEDFIIHHPKIDSDEFIKVGVNLENDIREKKTVKDIQKYIKPNVEIQINKKIDIQETDEDLNKPPDFMKYLPHIDSNSKYDEWIQITMAIKSIGGGDKYKELWLNWCDSATYLNNNLRIWNGLKNDGTCGIGTIIYYYKLHNKIREDYLDFIQNPTHLDAEELYKKENRNHIKCVDKQKKIFWLYDETTKLWSENNAGSIIYILSNKLKNPIEKIQQEIMKEMNEKLDIELAYLKDDSKKRKAKRKEIIKEDDELSESQELLKKIDACLCKIKTETWIKQVANYLASDCEILDTEFYFKLTSKTDILSVENGVVELKTGKLRERRFDDYCCDYIPIVYDKNANENDFQEFLRDLFDCEYYKKDLDAVMDFIELMLGYSITKSNNQTTAFILIGTGSNGKSVLCNVISKVFSKISVSVNQTLFDKNIGKDNANNATEALCALYNKNIAICNEIESDLKLGGFFKNFVDTGVLSGRKLYGSPFTFNITHKLFMLMNEMFYIPKDDEAVARRLICLKFENKYSAKINGIQPTGTKPINYHLEKELLENKEGILKWFVNASIKFYKSNGLGDRPTIIEKCKNDILDLSDWTKSLSFNSIDPTVKRTAFISNTDLQEQIRLVIGKSLNKKDINKVMCKYCEKTKRNGIYGYKGVIINGLEEMSEDDSDCEIE